MEKIIKIKSIGRVLFKKSNKAKNINISIESNKSIRVSVPKFLTYKYAEYIVYTKIDWIKKSIEKLSQKTQINRNNISFNKEKAKLFLLKRTYHLAKNNNFSINKILIKNQKTRWGSCSQNNNINLNIQLYRLPKELIDYVIFHELVHIYVKNHSKEFWDLLGKFVPNVRAVDKKLKEYVII